MTDFREDMVENLMYSDTLSGKDYLFVIELLGEPDYKDSTWIEYLIREKYESDIDPVYIKWLVIEFDSLKTVNKYYINTKK